MVDKSIGYRLSLYISVAVIIVFIAFIIAYFLFNQRLLRENLENKAIGLSAEVSSVIDREIVSIKEITTIASSQVAYYYQNGDLQSLLAPLVSNYPFIVSAEVYLDTTASPSPLYYAVIQDKNRLEYQQSKLPLFSGQTEKDYYTKPDKSNLAEWSKAYLWEETGEVVASYFSPIPKQSGEERTISGYLSTKLSLSHLNSTLKNINIGRGGYAFIIDSNGNYLTHPDEKRILSANIFSVSSKVLNRDKINFNDFINKKLKGSTIAYPDKIDYEKSWVYFSPVAETNWYLIFIMPYNELYQDLYEVTIRMAIFALLGVLLIYFLVSYITRKQIEPLKNITSRLTSFSSPFKLNTENEVKQVTNSLEYLKLWFEQYQIAREKEEQNNYQHSRDLQQASEIQQSLIKNTFPAFPDRTDIDVYAIYDPAQVVSGDLFDYYFIDDDNLVFTIGDVSGKGIPAAIFMSVCQTVIKNNARHKQPRKIVGKANHELATSNNHQYFLTLFLGILNVKTGELTYCNAAHTFPFILKADGNVKELSSTHGLPLGLYPDKKYKDDLTMLEHGDTILLYTDGVFDALNEKNILSGSKWFRKKLGKMGNYSPMEVTKSLQKDISRADSFQKDDICLMAIKYTP